MRIAYVNASYQKNHSGGGHVHVEQFIKNAIALGHEIWVYPGNQFPGATTIPTDHLNHIKTLRKMDALYIRLESWPPPILSLTVPPRRLLYGFPLVIWEFNTLPNELSSDQKILDKSNSKFYKYSSGCDLGVCVSPNLTEAVSSRLRIKRVITISNGSDPDLFTPEATIAPRMTAFEDKFNVVWIGTIKETWHDLDLIGDAAKLLWAEEKTRNINFHIIGAGLSGFMAGMPPNVFYWDAERYQRLPHWLAGMQAGLSLYKPGKSNYNSPLKLFDYMSSTLPVVSTEHPLAGDILKALGAEDLMIPFGDPEVLADVLIGLASDPERCKRIGAAGRQLVIERYNWHQAVSETLNVMSEILAEKRKISIR